MTSSLTTGDAVRRPAASRIPDGFLTLWFVAAVVLAVASSSVSYVAYRHYHPTYEAAAAVAFDQPRAVAASPNAGPLQKLSQVRLLYAGLIKTDVMTKPIATRLGLPRGVIASSVFASAQPQSLLLVVGSQRPDPAQARRIANALAGEIVRYVSETQRSAKVPQAFRMQARVVLDSRAAVQIAPTKKGRLAVAVLVWIFVFGIVLGVGAVWRSRR